MTATGKQKLMTLTENHNVDLHFNKGGPDPLHTLYFMLTLIDIILLSRNAKINVLRYVMPTFFCHRFFAFFRAIGVKKPLVDTNGVQLNSG